MELIISALILAFIVLSTALLLISGQRHQRLAQYFSQSQVDVRSAMTRMTRAVRHASAVVGSRTYSGSLGTISSDSTHIIVTVPQPSDTTTRTNHGTTIDIVFCLVGSTLYVQRSWESGPTVLLGNVTGFNVTYLDSSLASTSAASAIMARLDITTNQRGVTTKTSETVAMRNRLSGL